MLPDTHLTIKNSNETIEHLKTLTLPPLHIDSNAFPPPAEDIFEEMKFYLTINQPDQQLLQQILKIKNCNSIYELIEEQATILRRCTEQHDFVNYYYCLLEARKQLRFLAAAIRTNKLDKNLSAEIANCAIQALNKDHNDHYEMRYLNAELLFALLATQKESPLMKYMLYNEIFHQICNAYLQQEKENQCHVKNFVKTMLVLNPETPESIITTFTPEDHQWGEALTHPSMPLSKLATVISDSLADSNMKNKNWWQPDWLIALEAEHWNEEELIKVWKYNEEHQDKLLPMILKHPSCPLPLLEDNHHKLEDNNLIRLAQSTKNDDILNNLAYHSKTAVRKAVIENPEAKEEHQVVAALG